MAEPSEKPVVVDLCVERLKRSVMELHEIRKWVEQVPELAGKGHMTRACVEAEKALAELLLTQAMPFRWWDK